MKVGDLVRHTVCSTLGIGFVVGLKPKSSGVYVCWGMRNMRHPSEESDIMLEVVSESR